MSLGNFGKRPVRRRWLMAITMTAVAVGVSVAIVSAGATVAPSGFEGNDGNIVLGNNGTAGSNPTPPGNGTEDWATLSPAAGHIVDLTTNQDDSLGKGSKEDDLVPTTVVQGVPPKDDLRDVFLKTEHFAPTGATGNCPTASFPNGCDFLYEASMRQTSNGAANLNVELNQSTTLSSNNKTPVRTNGDRLITFDFTSGGARATLTELTWQSSGGTCADTNDSPPCWENQVTLDPNTAEGSANDGLLGRSGALTAALNPLTNVALDTNTFQEMSINLTAAGILPATGCETFPREEIKSRSSGATGTFNSALKDIVIGQQTISNCGQITIIKHTDPAGLDQNFSYTSTIPAPSGTPASPSCSPDTTAASFTLNDGSSTTNTEDCTNVAAGSYTVTEGADPTGFSFESLTCTKPTGDASTFSTSGKVASITLAPLGHVTCTYVNQKLTGALKILKNSSKGGAVANAGAVFSVSGHDNVTDNGTGDDDSTVGVVCVSGLATGSHTVNEVSPPPGYGSGTTATDQSVTVVAGTNCTNNLPGTGATATFTNPPLSDIQVNFRDGGSLETSATISCDNATGTGSDTAATGWDTTRTVTGVNAPTTVTCTIVIDP
jgi:hypothetical protein